MKQFYYFLLCLLPVSIVAQDYSLTISAKINGTATSLDSIVVHNLSSEKSYKTPPLKNVLQYVVKVSEMLSLGIAEPLAETQKNFTILKNTPGTVRLQYLSTARNETLLSVYTLGGQMVSQQSVTSGSGLSELEINLPGQQLYVLNFVSGNSRYAVKALGSSAISAIRVYPFVSGNASLKSAAVATSPEISIGDTVQVLAYKTGYKSIPQQMVWNGNKSVTLQMQAAFTDVRDGNVYRMVTLGTQTWMAENLAYLPQVSNKDWMYSSNPLWYVYDYPGENVAEAKNTINYKTKGVLYNWTAAMQSCPDGWELPSEEQWKTFSDYIDTKTYGYGSTQAEAIAADYGWESSNNQGDIGNSINKNNGSGWSAVSGGLMVDYAFNYLNQLAFFWTSTVWDPTQDKPYSYLLQYNGGALYRDYYHLKSKGMSVRCIKK